MNVFQNSRRRSASVSLGFVEIFRAMAATLPPERPINAAHTLV
jgi:hypothetical protein